jgi:hypothetical protein
MDSDFFDGHEMGPMMTPQFFLHMYRTSLNYKHANEVHLKKIEEAISRKNWNLEDLLTEELFNVRL